MPAALLPSSTDDYAEFTGEQLALETSERVRAIVRGSKIIGGRVRNGAQCFLNVPYALPVPRWTDAQPLPADWSYEEREYVADGLYCAQPQREYSTVPIRDRCGLGEPTDTPFFADIYIPSHVDLSRAESYDLPVKVFVHGGFLQFGSTSGNNYNQQAYAAEVRNEVRVLLGHRVSVLGFLAASSPNVDGNYGFKDALLGLEWVRDHVKSFGGDPQNVHLSGLSGGGHVVAQLLHQAARRAPLPAPYRTATLYSNAILCDAAELDSCQSQFDALCLQLGLDPRATDVLDALRAMPTKQLIAAVERLGKHSTFRGTQGRDGWMQELVKFQSSPAFSRGLRAAGVESVFVGEVSEERAFYQQVHPAASTDELVPNLMRYYPEQEARRLAATYPPLSKASSGAEIDAHFGQILADGQVHIPIRKLAQDLLRHDFPCVRFQSRYLTERWRRSIKHVQHGTDLVLHHLRLPALEPFEVGIALNLLQALDEEYAAALDGRRHAADEMLCLFPDGTLEWTRDDWWDTLLDKESSMRA